MIATISTDLSSGGLFKPISDTIPTGDLWIQVGQENPQSAVQLDTQVRVGDGVQSSHVLHLTGGGDSTVGDLDVTVCRGKLRNGFDVGNLGTKTGLLRGRFSVVYHNKNHERPQLGGREPFTAFLFCCQLFRTAHKTRMLPTYAPIPRNIPSQ